MMATPELTVAVNPTPILSATIHPFFFFTLFFLTGKNCSQIHDDTVTLLSSQIVKTDPLSNNLLQYKLLLLHKTNCRRDLLSAADPRSALSSS